MVWAGLSRSKAVSAPPFTLVKPATVNAWHRAVLGIQFAWHGRYSRARLEERRQTQELLREWRHLMAALT